MNLNLMIISLQIYQIFFVQQYDIQVLSCKLLFECFLRNYGSIFRSNNGSESSTDIGEPMDTTGGDIISVWNREQNSSEHLAIYDRMMKICLQQTEARVNGL
jgi:hypothetical protein